ncbi:MAG TPA: hypothetical protein PKE06_22240 [Flavilitoribacter sp.]|nr:hypothetical protein [Lewinella sp.]MCB9280099.1 hypothetical protein [Lewinellaceae bacterium]HMQ63420.1 hypothetical protein [Flavilitoribacter sp.]HMQ89909.1 hypothetical protein [Flavilitoribacter sp.]
MKKDIPQLKVVDLAVAIAPRQEEGVQGELWDTFLINLKEEPIRNVLISSRGYGELDGEQLQTTTLRHFFEEIPPLSAAQIEPIQTSLFGLNNEYWVSFSFNDYMYDKKYTFVQGSISEDYFTSIPFLDCQGVMIR